MPTPQFDASGREKANLKEKEKRGDVFEPPYNPNLYVGELQDEEEGAEYVVLVSRLVRHLKRTETDVTRCSRLMRLLLCSSTSTLSSKNIFSWSPKVRFWLPVLCTEKQ